MATTSYKVVEHEYQNRSVPEEGPGSTHDVVSDVTKHVIYREDMDSDMPGEQVLAYLSDLLSDQMEEDNAFDSTEYNYFVYRNDGGKWKFVGKLTRTPELEDPFPYLNTRPDEDFDVLIGDEDRCLKCGELPGSCWCNYVPEEEPDPMDTCYFCGKADCPGGCFEETKTCRVLWSRLRLFWRMYYWLHSLVNRRVA